MKPIVRNIETGDLYEYGGENVFTNLRTLQSGKVGDKAAQRTFKINVEATAIINEYPLLKELIKAANLKFEK